MAAQRRIDLVLDSVKRLLRIGATANLLNLLQKQHPADLAQIFSQFQDKEREATFSLLAERNGRLAMEAVSELGPEAGAALLATRQAEEIARLAQEIPSDDAAARVLSRVMPTFSTTAHVVTSMKRGGVDTDALFRYFGDLAYAAVADLNAGKVVKFRAADEKQ